MFERTHGIYCVNIVQYDQWLFSPNTSIRAGQCTLANVQDLIFYNSPLKRGDFVVRLRRELSRTLSRTIKGGVIIIKVVGFCLLKPNLINYKSLMYMRPYGFIFYKHL